MRTTSFGAFFMFIFLASFFISSDAFAQSCNSELTVNKDRDRRSASELDPTQYLMELTNNGFSSQTYQIGVSNYQGSFSVKGKQPAVLSSSYSIDTAVLQNNIQNNTITVPARSTGVFKLAITVPSGTPPNKWTALEVNAVSSACPNGTVTKVVKLYISDPTEE